MFNPKIKCKNNKADLYYLLFEFNKENDLHQFFKKFPKWILVLG